MEHTNLLSIIAVVAAFIALAVSIVAFIKCGNLKNKIDGLNDRVNRRETKDEAKLMEQRLTGEINGLKKLIPQNNSAVVTSAVKKDKTTTASSREETVPESLKEKPKDVEHTLYASSYDSERNQFFAIENSPSQKTIYKITYFESNPEVGYFTIFNEAGNKVVECRDHLEAASEIEGRGKKIDWDTLNPGRLQKKDNNWEVVTPLTVKFV